MMKLSKLLQSISLKASSGVGPDAAIAEAPIKLRNEKRLNRKLRSIFNRMANDIKTQIARTGTTANLDNYILELKSVIRQDSGLTTRSFYKNLQNRLKIKDKVIRQRILKEMNHYIEQSSLRQAMHIVDTTNKNIDSTIMKVAKDAAANNETLTNQQISQRVSSDFKKKNRNRTAGISKTEVQRVAEKTKNTEANILSQAQKVKRIKKRWDATLDFHTRKEHAKADGQIVDLNEPFQVWGELLMHPGDTSMGASLRNIINCRCTTQFLTE